MLTTRQKMYGHLQETVDYERVIILWCLKELPFVANSGVSECIEVYVAIFAKD